MLICLVVLFLHLHAFNVWNVTLILTLVLYKECPLKHIYYTKLLYVFHMTVLLDYMNALLEYIDQFALDLLIILAWLQHL